jgi:hypothetical protein
MDFNLRRRRPEETEGYGSILMDFLETLWFANSGS